MVESNSNRFRSPSVFKTVQVPDLITLRKWSEYKDSNLGPPGPKPGALPGCATLRNSYLTNCTVDSAKSLRPCHQPFFIPSLKIA